MALCRQEGNAYGIATLHARLGQVATEQGDCAGARADFEASLAQFEIAQRRVVNARRSSAKVRFIADEDDALRRFGADHRLDDGRRQMVPIDDQAGG